MENQNLALLAEVFTEGKLDRSLCSDAGFFTDATT